MQETKVPSVLICLLAKNDAEFLPRFLEAMKKLDYPTDKLKWLWMYGKSVDDTLKIILEFHEEEKYKFEVYEEPIFNNPTRNAMYVAVPCNEFRRLMGEVDFVLMADTDVVTIPPETLKELITQDKDIIAPYPYIEKTSPRRFYDTYVFRLNKQKFESVTIDGKQYNALNPPFKDEKKPVQLDSVGTFYLIKSKVFKEVPFDNPCPAYQFCKNARGKGYTIWALPSLQIEHANVEGIEEPHFPVEWYVARRIIPPSELEKMKE